MAERDYIAVRWCVEDVQAVRPDLTNDQARTVLYAVKSHHDATIGVNWDVIEAEAEELYPKKEDAGNE